MKRNILSVLLVCLMIVSVFVFAGCKTDDLEVQINDNKEAAEKAATEAAENLEKAKTALEKLIEDGDTANTAALKKAVDEFDAALEEMAQYNEEAVEAAVVEVSAKFEKMIDDLQAELDKAVADLETLDGSQADIEKAVADLQAKISSALGGAATAKEYTDMKFDQAAKALEDAVANLNASVKSALEAVVNFKADWNDATDVIYDTLLDLDEYVAGINYLLYYDDQLNELYAHYSKAQIKILRALTEDDAAQALVDFKEDVAAVKEKSEVIYENLTKVIPTLQDVAPTQEHLAAITEALTEINQILSVQNGDANVLELQNSLYNVTEENINLVELANDMQYRYNMLANCERDKAQNLLAQMNAAYKLHVLYNEKELFTIVNKLIADYKAWLGVDDPQTPDVDEAEYTTKYAKEIGLDVAYGKMVSMKARFMALREAGLVANILNGYIADLIDSIAKTSVSNYNVARYANVPALLETWTANFFSGDYADEKTEDNANYNLINWANKAELDEKYAAAVALFDQYVKPYVEAVQAIEAKVTLSTGAKIDEAEQLFITFQQNVKTVTVYDKIFAERLEGADTAEGTLALLAAKRTEYDKLVATALAEYEKVKATVELTTAQITIYDEAKIVAAEAWFAKYAAIEEGKVIETYKLSDTVTVGDAQYQNVKALRAAFDALEEAKIAETNALKALIASLTAKYEVINDVPADVDTKNEIDAAKADLEAWKNGTNVPEGYTADQFKASLGDNLYDTGIDTQKLAETEAKYNELAKQVEDIQALITALENKKVSTDFADKADRDAYNAKLAKIAEALGILKTSNGGAYNAEMFTGYDKIAAGKLAVARFDAVEKTKADSAAAKAAIANVSEQSANAFAELVKQATDAINAAADQTAINTVVKNANTKYTAISAVEALYAAELAKIAKIDAAEGFTDDEKTAIKENVASLFKMQFKAHILDADVDNLPDELVLEQIAEALSAPLKDAIAKKKAANA